MSMNKISAIIIMAAFLCSCSDSWRIDQQAKTLSGSVSSIDFFLYEGSIDGKVIIPSLGCPHRLFIERATDNSITIAAIINPDAHLSDIEGISTSPVTLHGKAGDVSFDETVKLSLSNESVTNARVSGHLQKMPITRTSPIQPNLTGVIEMVWVSSEDPGTEHRFIINKIISQYYWSDYLLSETNPN